MEQLAVANVTLQCTVNHSMAYHAWRAAGLLLFKAPAYWTSTDSLQDDAGVNSALISGVQTVVVIPADRRHQTAASVTAEPLHAIVLIFFQPNQATNLTDIVLS